MAAKLTQEQADAVARALAGIARIDGRIDPRELALLERFRKACGCQGEMRLGHVDQDELAKLLGGGETARTFLRTCCLMAVADARFSEEEAMLITRYADALGVPRGELAAIEEQALRYVGHAGSESSVPEGALEQILLETARLSSPDLAATAHRLFATHHATRT
jgi:tellurite resistance protein